MAEVLLMRLDAPLMSFGGVLVDDRHPTSRFPQRSLLVGLVGNALGLDFRDFDALGALQLGLVHAARWDVAPKLVRDYHTVDLGVQKMLRGWTTRGIERRAGGSSTQTHPTERMYWSDGVMTVAVAFAGAVSASRAHEALRAPERPLYIGRKCCMPACPLSLGVVQASDVLQALLERPVEPHDAARSGAESAEVSLEASWPDGTGQGIQAERREVVEAMDWRNRVHVGRSVRLEGRITVPVRQAP